MEYSYDDYAKLVAVKKYIGKYIGMKFKERQQDIGEIAAMADNLKYPDLKPLTGYKGLFSATRFDGEYGLEFEGSSAGMYASRWYYPIIEKFASMVRESSDEGVQRAIKEYYQRNNLLTGIASRKYTRSKVVLDIELALALGHISKQEAIKILEDYNTLQDIIQIIGS